MRSAVDSNVIVGIWSRKPTASRMATLLRQARAAGPRMVAAPVWAELHAAPGAPAAIVARFLTDTGIGADLDLGEGVWRRAAIASSAYATPHLGGRRTEATARRLPRRCARPGARRRLLTLDPQRYRSAFGDLRIEP